ncbi:hypothetical protein ABPG77_002913 [Micractinium sp. CCAP 211/92]
MCPKPGVLTVLSACLVALHAVNLSPVRVRAEHAQPCPEHCLRCDASGSCLACAARYGLTSGSPRRCRACMSKECIDCNVDYRKCSRCGFGSWFYLDKAGRCKQCASIYGPCDQSAGCHADGRCKACNVFPDTFEDGFNPYDSFVMINGTCQPTPFGCLVSRTLPDGRCSRCIAPGYVLLHNGTCKECPSLCSNCTASGRCLRCNDGYSRQAGRCVKCSVRGCTRCSEDPSVCERCQTGNNDWVDGSLGLKEGKCVRCQDPNCSDCGSNWAKCRACVGPGSYSNGTVLKDGKCVQCLGACDPDRGSCDASLECPRCMSGWGKVGKACKQCEVANCSRCDGDTAKCLECDWVSDIPDATSVDDLYPLYPSRDGTACIKCPIPHALECSRGSRGGRATRCAPHFGAVGSACLPCRVKGCQQCNGDVNACDDCGGDDCFWNLGKYSEFDARTKACVTFFFPSPFCEL